MTNLHASLGLRETLREPDELPPGFDSPAQYAIQTAIMAEIENERIRRGMTQQEFAARVGVDRPRYWRMKKNKQGISMAVLARFASTYGMRVRVFGSE